MNHSFTITRSSIAGNSPPLLQIDCSKLERADAPQPTCHDATAAAAAAAGLVDYRTRKASLAGVDEPSSLYKIRHTLRSASNHERRMTLLKHKRDQMELEQQHLQQHHDAMQDGSRTSMVDLVPPGHSSNANANTTNNKSSRCRYNNHSSYSSSSMDHSDFDDDDDYNTKDDIDNEHNEENIEDKIDDKDDSSQSEVIFAMKITKPSRLRRRRRSLFTSNNHYHNSTNSNRSGLNLHRSASTRSNNKLLMSSNSSFLDGSITLQSLAGIHVHPDIPEENADEFWMHPSIRSIPAEDLALPPIYNTNYTSSGSNGNFNVSNDLLSQQTCSPNQTSFQTNYWNSFSVLSANFDNTKNINIGNNVVNVNATNNDNIVNNTSFPVVKRTIDLRKQRRSMMNWLANRQASRNLMAPPSQDPKPPTFVKVIRLHEDVVGEQHKQQLLQLHEDQIQAWLFTNNHNDKLDGMSSTHSSAGRSLLLDNSHHHKVASSMA